MATKTSKASKVSKVSKTSSVSSIRPTQISKSTKTSKTTTSVVKSSSSQKSVENGIKILTTATQKNLSLSEASRQHGFGRNYVSDVKSSIGDNYKKKNVSRETYTTFKTLLKQYNS